MRYPLHQRSSFFCCCTDNAKTPRRFKSLSGHIECHTAHHILRLLHRAMDDVRIAGQIVEAPIDQALAILLGHIKGFAQQKE